jgi:hypothetical protein
MPFCRWRQQARLLRTLELLASGQKVIASMTYTQYAREILVIQQNRLGKRIGSD